MKMKKALAAVLTASIAVSAVPMTAWAESGETAGTGAVQDETLIKGTAGSEVKTTTTTPDESKPEVDEPVIDSADAFVDAVNDANDGCTITLNDSFELNQAVTFDKEIELDLNGKTITLGNSGLFKVLGGELTIVDSGKDGAIHKTATTNVINVGKDGKLIVEDGTITNDWYVVYVYSNGQATIKGGTLESKDASALSTNGSASGENYSKDAVMNVAGGELISKNDVAIFVPAGTLNVTGGEITGATAIYCKAGKVNLTGGTIQGTGNANYQYTANGCYPTGDAIVIDDCGYPTGPVELEINGGKFISEKKDAVGYYAEKQDASKPAKVEVSDGEFSSPVKVEFLADDLQYEAKDENGVITYHSSLSEAQQAGSVVTQVKDENGGSVAGKVQYTVTIDPDNGSEETELTVPEGSKINVNDLDTPSKSRYKFRGWAVDGVYVSEVVVDKDNIEIVAQWKKKSSSSGGGSSSSSSSSKEYSISIDKDIENGTVKVDPSKAEKGDKVTITVKADKGYEISKVVVKDADGEKIDLKDEGKGEYTFTMPKSEVEIDAKFVKADEEKPEVPEEAKKIVLTINQKIANVFGEYVVNDVAPVIRAERTMLPIRFVAKALGAEVAWDDALNKVTITKDDMKIELIIGSAIAVVNGENVTLDAPAFIENSRTYLPLRFVAENLGATVTWDAAAQQVTIVPGK